MKSNSSTPMRHFSPDPDELTGNTSSRVPSGMDNDPNADEEVIDQNANEEYPKPVEKSAKIVPDDLADSIAYALDGSGPGPTNDKPNVSGHKVITEGITGAGPEMKKLLCGLNGLITIHRLRYLNLQGIGQC